MENHAVTARCKDQLPSGHQRISVHARSQHSGTLEVQRMFG
jgi:hypothetical protein